MSATTQLIVLNSAVGSKAANFRIILAVAALGVLVGCTFSTGNDGGCPEGVFSTRNISISQNIILLFLAVMITDVILLDAFNSFGNAYVDDSFVRFRNSSEQRLRSR